MATNVNDLKIYYSGAEVLDEIQNNPVLSIGGFRSSTIVPNSKLQNLFDNVGIKELTEGSETICCLFIKNISLIDNMQNLSLYVSGKEDYEEILFGVSIPSTTDGEVQRLSSNNELPYNIVFDSAYTEEDKIILKETLDAGKTIALWIQRKINTNIDYETKKDHSLNFVFNWS